MLEYANFIRATSRANEIHVNKQKDLKDVNNYFRKCYRQ